MQSQSLIEALVEVLRQEVSLLNCIDDVVYAAPAEGAFRSSIGAHIRHNLDHFEAFFRGLPTGRIDYEQRRRDTRIAVSTDCALGAVAGYLWSLQSLSENMGTSMEVREESEDGAETPMWLASTVGRELQFLLGHTVHHHAIVALLADRHGTALPEGFGVAPSTQRYERNNEKAPPNGGAL
jgi:hypothetical protein